MNPVGDLFSRLSDKELEAVDKFLLALEYDKTIFGASEFDGFATAIVSDPIAIPPSQWLETVWGDQEHAPEWESEKEFEQIFRLLMRHMNSTAEFLIEAPLKIGLVDYCGQISHNDFNTTVTLSTRKGNAQPWRFFLCPRENLGQQQCLNNTRSRR